MILKIDLLTINEILVCRLHVAIFSSTVIDWLYRNILCEIQYYDIVQLL